MGDVKIGRLRRLRMLTPKGTLIETIKTEAFLFNMNSMNNPYNIVCVSDEGYTQHLAVMLCSLFETNKDKAFCIYLLTIHLSKETEQKLADLCRRYGAVLFVYPCPIDDISHLPTGQWNVIMYLKLFIPQVLPANIERCLFLDVDMVINANISELYHIDLGNKVLAAAEDIPDCILHKQRLNMSDEDFYINSGVMVCNVVQWRKMEYECPIFDYIPTIAHKILNEQDVIALYFKEQIKILPIRWNMVTFYFNRVPKIFPKYLPELPEAKRYPGIIHFAAPIKPWYRDSQHPYAYLYRKYLKLTPWKNYKYPYGEKLTIRQRINKYIKNYLNRIGVIKNEGYTVPVRNCFEMIK